MHLRVCVSEERGDGEGAGSSALSDTLRYINLSGSLVYYESIKRELKIKPIYECRCGLSVMSGLSGN